MDIKWKLCNLYKNEMLHICFNNDDEGKIVDEIRQCSIIPINYILTIYDKINNFSYFMNNTFSFSKDFTLDDVHELKNKLIKEINEDLINFIINYCNDNKIEYSTLNDILIINDEIYSQGNHLFYNIFEIDKKLISYKMKNTR